MSELETADKLAKQIAKDLIHGDSWFFEEYRCIAWIEARDAAVRLALLDEIESAMFGFFKRNPDHAFTAVLPMTIRELRIKYTRTP